MPDAIIGLIILLLAVVLFLTRIFPAPITALLASTSFALLGFCSVQEAFSGFSNSVIILVASMMVVGAAMKNTGLSKVIGSFVIRVSNGDERRFILFGGTIAAIMSAFLSNTAVNAMFLTVIEALSEADKRIQKKNLVFPIVICTMIGGVSTLVGSTTQLTAQGIIQSELGLSMGVWDYTLPGIFLFGIFMFYALLIGYPLGNRIWNHIQNEDGQEHFSDCQKHINVDKKVYKMILILSFAIIMFIGGWIDIALVAIVAAFLCIITGCIDFKSAVREINWSVIFLLAGCLGISKGISNCGTVDLIGNAVTSIIGAGIPVIMVFAVFVIATMVVSNFISNSAAILLFLPIAISVCKTMNLNIELFTIGIVFAASLSFSTPLANAQVGMALSAGYKFSDYIRYTWLYDLMVVIFIIAVLPVFIPLVN